MIMMMLKFTSQSVEFDRARDTDLSQHVLNDVLNNVLTTLNNPLNYEHDDV